MQLGYTYREQHLGGGHATSDEQWADRTPAYYDWELDAVHISNCYDMSTVGAIVDGVWVDTAAQVGDFIYAVVVRYSTGDTFGSSHGHGTVACFCTDAESARQATEAIRRGEVPLSERGCAEWQGYFESLDSVTAQVMCVLPERT